MKTARCGKCDRPMGGWPPINGIWECYDCTPQPTQADIQARLDLEIRMAEQVVCYWIRRLG